MKNTVLTIISIITTLAASVVFAVVVYSMPKELPKEDPVGDGTVQTEQTTSGTSTTTSTTGTTTTRPTVSTKPLFTTAPDGYFKDALFIGDSRTVGLADYGGIDGATFFASSGLSVYKIDKERVLVKNIGRVTLRELLKNKKYSKIYVMMGVNELGYDLKTSVRKYGGLVETICQQQPHAVVYIGANLHVSKTMSDTSDIYNNKNINAFNAEIKKLADDTRIFYLDVNEVFDDAQGNLDLQYTYDNSHLLGRYYRTWAEWLSEKVIVK